MTLVSPCFATRARAARMVQNDLKDSLFYANGP